MIAETNEKMSSDIETISETQVLILKIETDLCHAVAPPVEIMIPDV
jgi:hypothetical protein